MSDFEIKVLTPTANLVVYCYYIDAYFVASQAIERGKQASITAITGTFGNDFITI